MSNGLAWDADGTYVGLAGAVSLPVYEDGSPVQMKTEAPQEASEDAETARDDGPTERTKPDLVERAKELGLSGYSRLNRDDLEAFVVAAEAVDLEGEYETEGLSPDDFTQQGTLKVATQREQENDE